MISDHLRAEADSSAPRCASAPTSRSDRYPVSSPCGYARGSLRPVTSEESMHAHAGHTRSRFAGAAAPPRALQVTAAVVPAPRA